MAHKKDLQDVGGFWNVSRKRRVLQILVFCILACGVAAWQWGGQMQPARNGKVKEVRAEGKKGKKEKKKHNSKKKNNKKKKNKDKDKEKKVLGLKEEKVDIRIPGLKKRYKFVFLSDLHILVENKEVSTESLEEVRARRELFCTEKGMYSARLWKKLPDFINSMDVDAVLLGGDMVDYASTSNLKCLKRGIKKIKAPVVYVRADHDYEPFHCRGLSKKKMKRLHQSMDGYPGISLLEFEDLCIVGINDSTKQISKKQLKQIQKIFAKEKPVILLTHVPLNSLMDTSLEKASKEAWQSRALVWGKGCYYKPNQYTRKFLKLVYGKKSPVKAVLGGHLHFSWEGKLAKGILQHVFSPAYTGSMGIVTVDGK